MQPVQRRAGGSVKATRTITTHLHRHWAAGFARLGPRGQTAQAWDAEAWCWAERGMGGVVVRRIAVAVSMGRG